MVAIVGNTTWELKNAKKVLQEEWGNLPESSFNIDARGNEVKVPPIWVKEL